MSHLNYNKKYIPYKIQTIISNENIPSRCNNIKDQLHWHISGRVPTFVYYHDYVFLFSLSYHPSWLKTSLHPGSNNKLVPFFEWCHSDVESPPEPTPRLLSTTLLNHSSTSFLPSFHYECVLTLHCSSTSPVISSVDVKLAFTRYDHKRGCRVLTECARRTRTASLQRYPEGCSGEPSFAGQVQHLLCTGCHCGGYWVLLWLMLLLLLLLTTGHHHSIVLLQMRRPRHGWSLIVIIMIIHCYHTSTAEGRLAGIACEIESNQTQTHRINHHVSTY